MGAAYASLISLSNTHTTTQTCMHTRRRSSYTQTLITLHNANTGVVVVCLANEPTQLSLCFFFFSPLLSL